MDANFLTQATEAGFPYALVLDFLDQLGHGRWQSITEPTIKWLQEYADESQSEYNAQVAWDASQRQDPVNPGGYQRTIWGV